MGFRVMARLAQQAICDLGPRILAYVFQAGSVVELEWSRPATLSTPWDGALQFSLHVKMPSPVASRLSSSVLGTVTGLTQPATYEAWKHLL